MSELLRQAAGLRLVGPRSAAGTRRGERRAAARGHGGDFADHRAYDPGDDLRHVDWNAYLRSGALRVKQFHADRNLRVVLLVDASASMGFGSKLQSATALARALAWVGLRHRDRVEVLRVGGGGGRARAGAPVDLGALDRALSCDTASGAADLVAALRAAGGPMRADVAVLFSDLLVEDEVRDATLRALAALARRPALVHVLGADDLQPDWGAIQARDAETGERLDLSGSRAERAAYARVLAEWRAEVHAGCRQRGVRCVDAPTDTEPRALLADLRRLGVLEPARPAR